MITVMLLHAQQANGTWDSEASEYPCYEGLIDLASTKGLEDLESSRVFLKTILKEEVKEYKIAKEVIYYG